MKLPHSHIAFYDFDSILGPSMPLGQIENKKLYPIAYSYIIIDREGEVVEKMTSSGGNVINHIINDITCQRNAIQRTLPYYPMNMMQMSEMHFQFQFQALLEKGSKHRHHNHTIERNNYKGVLCQTSNMQCVNSCRVVSVFSHNASYDLGLLIKDLELIQGISKDDVDVFAKLGYKFMNVKVGNVRLTDTLLLMPVYLTKLTANYTTAGKSLKCKLHMIDDVPREAHKLLLTVSSSSVTIICQTQRNWTNSPSQPRRTSLII